MNAKSSKAKKVSKKREDGGTPPALHATIFLGASALSMMIAEKRGKKLKEIDFLTQPVPLSRDVYRQGHAGRHTMERCVKILNDFSLMIREYGQGADVNVRFHATNILQDIDNLDTFINRLHIAGDMRLRVTDDGEMARLIYMGVRDILRKNPALLKKKVLTVHVGPGNTRILLFERGRITHYSSYRLGAFRTGETVGEIAYGGGETESALLREHIRSQIDQVRHDLSSVSHIDTMILLGDEIQKLRHYIEGELTVENIAALTSKIAGLSYEQRMLEYEADFSSIAGLLPAMLINLSLVRALQPNCILSPLTDEYAKGFLRSLITDETSEDELKSEMLHFSSLLADRYKVDRNHGKQVAELCLSLFDQLAFLHRLGQHDRLLLHMAAILHEVGTYINPKRHHRHSQYIILNSEIFGLCRSDVELIALLARYHRHNPPSLDDPEYAELDQHDRLRVQKLTAILRVADALERSHTQRIRDFRIQTKGRKLELLVPDIHDITIEEMAMKIKGELFSDIFGYEISIVPIPTA